MTDARGQSDVPTAFEIESVLVITGAVLAGPMLPGFTLCVPGLVVMAIGALAPLVAAAAIVASPSLG